MAATTVVVQTLCLSLRLFINVFHIPIHYLRPTCFFSSSPLLTEDGYILACGKSALRTQSYDYYVSMSLAADRQADYFTQLLFSN